MKDGFIKNLVLCHSTQVFQACTLILGCGRLRVRLANVQTYRIRYFRHAFMSGILMCMPAKGRLGDMLVVRFRSATKWSIWLIQAGAVWESQQPSIMQLNYLKNPAEGATHFRNGRAPADG